ncbi:MAG TPA: NigD-like C-terminal domain-containing protein [Bacteroidales bacterium]
MKTWIPTLFLVLLAFSVTSCIKTSEDDTTNYYDIIATMTTVDDYPTFQTDDGTTLNCTNKITPDTASFKIGNRFYLRFAFGDSIGHALKNYPIAVSKIWNVDTKDFVSIEKDSTDNYYNQALQSISSIDLSGNYFNMVFNTFGQSGTRDTYELVRIKEVESTTPLDTVPTLFFELRHNVYIVNYAFYNTRFASFKLSPLLTEFPLAKKFKLNLKWLVYPNATQDSYVFTYEPASTNLTLAPLFKSNLKSEKNLQFSKSSFTAGF